ALPPLPLSRVQQADPACTELLELSLGPCDFYMRGTDGFRSGSPRHALAVIGCGPTDRLQPLASAAAADWPRAQPPFLLFGSGQWGVWFRDEADCQRMAKRLAQLADGAAEVATAQQAETGDGALSASESIVEMLGRAQAQYEATAAAGQGAQACEMVARRIREQLGLAQPEDNAVAAAEASPGSADINVDTRAAAETGGLAAGCQWREIGPVRPECWTDRR
uniref:Flavodoxin-like domain-containing protein n=2 Tax=Macrostomum lignano TaxID=282301 RepID=A0A1I8G6P5_9PLAT